MATKTSSKTVETKPVVEKAVAVKVETKASVAKEEGKKTETKKATKADVKKTETKKTAKADVKKTEAKKAIKADAKKVVEKTEEKKTTKETAKKTSKVFVQFFGREVDTDTAIEAAKADYIAKSGKKTVKSVEVYIKPEDNAAYYVIDGVEGVVSL